MENKLSPCINSLPPLCTRRLLVEIAPSVYPLRLPRFRDENRTLSTHRQKVVQRVKQNVYHKSHPTGVSSSHSKHGTSEMPTSPSGPLSRPAKAGTTGGKETNRLLYLHVLERVLFVRCVSGREACVCGYPLVTSVIQRDRSRRRTLRHLNTVVAVVLVVALVVVLVIALVAVALVGVAGRRRAPLGDGRLWLLLHLLLALRLLVVRVCLRVGRGVSEVLG